MINGLLEDVRNLESFSDGKPQATPTQIRNYVLELIEIIDQLDKRLQALEASP
jgi:hypothetical protein